MADDTIKVLIVDDIPETRENLKKLLAFENDIEVVGAAKTGREGLEICGETKPDIILMDINMPDMDGITATEELRKLLPTSGVIMMSVQSESDYLRRAMLAGARDFLNKPISGENLYETIRRVYDLLQQDRQRFGGMVGDASGERKAVKSKKTGHIIAVYSPQGGAGTTTIATNMAIALMSEGTRVILLDTDLQFGDIGVFLNVQNKHNIANLSNSVGELDQPLIDNIAVGHPSGLKVVIAPATPAEAEKIVPADLAQVVRELASMYDYVIVDMSKRLDDTTLNIMDAAEKIVLVATPTLPAIKNTRVMLDLFDELQYEKDKVLFVMNRVSNERRGRAAIPIEAIENNLRRKTVARIPLDDLAFLSAVNQGVSVLSGDPNKSPAVELMQLALSVKRSVEGLEEPDLEDEPVQQKKPSGIGRFLGRG